MRLSSDRKDRDGQVMETEAEGEREESAVFSSSLKEVRSAAHAKQEDSLIFASDDPIIGTDGMSTYSPPIGGNKGAVSRRIYIAGVGSVGSFIAHSLRGVANPPPVTLLFHREQTFDTWEARNKSITVRTHGMNEPRSGFEVERLWDMRKPDAVLPPEASFEEPILHLIIATKTLNTVAALRGLRHRLGPDSTICFMQNGMGVVDEVSQEIFPDPNTRPRYVCGVISHGLFSERKFFVDHRGQGTISMSINKVNDNLNGEEPEKTPRRSLWNQSSRYMMRTLTRTSVLSAIGLNPEDLLTFQLEKLAVNCVINPLTAIFNCTNGELLYNKHARALMRLILAEVSLVIRSLPELQAHYPPAPITSTSQSPGNRPGQNEDMHHGIAYKFSSERLEYAVRSVMQQTAENRSSMLMDISRGEPSEINYLNGYIVRRGEELGINCVINFMISQMVDAKGILQMRQDKGLGPLDKWTQLNENLMRNIAWRRD